MQKFGVEQKTHQTKSHKSDKNVWTILVCRHLRVLIFVPNWGLRNAWYSTSKTEDSFSLCLRNSNLNTTVNNGYYLFGLLLFMEIVGDCGERVWLVIVATCGDGGGFAAGGDAVLLMWVGLQGSLDR